MLSARVPAISGASWATMFPGAQLGQAQAAQVDAVQQDAPPVGPLRQQVDQRALAHPRGAGDGDLRACRISPRPCRPAWRSRLVAEAHAFHPQRAARRWRNSAALCLIGETGALARTPTTAPPPLPADRSSVRPSSALAGSAARPQQRGDQRADGEAAPPPPAPPTRNTSAPVIPPISPGKLDEAAPAISSRRRSSSMPRCSPARAPPRAARRRRTA